MTWDNRYMGNAWPADRRARAREVAEILDTTILKAYLLIARAERSGVAHDRVDWDAVQVGPRADFTELVAQLDSVLHRETVTAEDSRRLVDLGDGRFVDVAALEEEYGTN